MTIYALLESWGGVDRFAMHRATVALIGDVQADVKILSRPQSAKLLTHVGSSPVLMRLGRVQNGPTIYLTYDDSLGIAWDASLITGNAPVGSRPPARLFVAVSL